MRAGLLHAPVDGALHCSSTHPGVVTRACCLLTILRLHQRLRDSLVNWMLRQASRLLLPRGALCQALSCQQQLLQHGTPPWGQQQTRSKSDAPSVPPTTSADAASFLHDPIEGSTTELISQADTLVSASQAASDSVVLAAQAASWWGTSTFIDVLMWAHEGIGLPW